MRNLSLAIEVHDVAILAHCPHGLTVFVNNAKYLSKKQLRILLLIVHSVQDLVTAVLHRTCYLDHPITILFKRVDVFQRFRLCLERCINRAELLARVPPLSCLACIKERKSILFVLFHCH
eukprot:gnl/MRDRNA2_/MRDRNA2_123248_c0_seq1.p1 gnl/MRDRNA2_/MRDRNA2_123248_c0~~gnl/MRDRNA2_/MRDRNA2_123248_c0_seq1.p1  ORF type:complete len:120 (-),score=7.53 gnl/MRDRNA2_/MRDRNA2_123248_c0_seq1:78-437(-)